MQTTLPSKEQEIISIHSDLAGSKSSVPQTRPWPEGAPNPATESLPNGLSKRPLLRLARDLIDEVKTLFRQEIKLARKEMTEKLSFLGRNAAGLGAGVGIAYAGAIVLLIGIGFLVAWAIHLAGIQGLFAAFLGLAGIGLLTVIVGGSLIVKGISALKAESLAPERTLQTLQELKGGPVPKTPRPPPAPKMPEPSSAEMQSRVETTEGEIGQTLEALHDRLSPSKINARIKHRIQVHPYRAGLLAMGAGLASGFALRRRFHHT